MRNAGFSRDDFHRKAYAALPQYGRGGFLRYGHDPRGKRANLLARAIIVATVVVMVLWDTYFWILMFLLVLLLGPDHPQTIDDDCRTGWFRQTLGWAALLIPVLCFPALGITPIGQ